MLHPRPQLARDRWLDLRGNWEFAFDAADVGLKEGWQSGDALFSRTIAVPFPFESAASGIGDTGFHTIIWYRRAIDISPPDTGKRAILHFGAIDYEAMVWVNGELIGTHRGGQTSFEADITRPLTRGESRVHQVIVVRAVDRPADRSQPRGKQDWEEESHAIWYDRTSGIWQPVWLEIVAATHVAELRWTPRVERLAIEVGVTLSRAVAPSTEVRVELTLDGASFAGDTLAVRGTGVHQELELGRSNPELDRDALLWSPDSPNLIDATVSVLEEGIEVDRVRSYAGLRSVEAADGCFRLNGRPLYLRMVLEQGYWPDSHLAAPSDEALRWEVELAKELGFNGVRIHQKVEDPRFLYWCDRLGLLVWAEMANAYEFSPTAAERLVEEWIQVVRRDYSHPCIVAWVPINESWGVPQLARDPAQQSFVRGLYHLTRALDPTRPVVANDGWEYLCGDLFGIHDYAFTGAEIEDRYGSNEAITRTIRERQPSGHVLTVGEPDRSGVPLVLSEFGGIGYRPEAGTPWYGYGTVSDRAAFEEKYRELVNAILACPGIAGFCYTQLTDTQQETNGLLDENRRPKVDPQRVRSINCRLDMNES